MKLREFENVRVTEKQKNTRTFVKKFRADFREINIGAKFLAKLISFIIIIKITHTCARCVCGAYIYVRHDV